jgi:hypothetical protein
MYGCTVTNSAVVKPRLVSSFLPSRPLRTIRFAGEMPYIKPSNIIIAGCGLLRCSVSIEEEKSAQQNSELRVLSDSFIDSDANLLRN